MTELEILQRIQASIASLDQRVASLDRRVIGQLSILSQDVRMIRSALHDIGETRVSEGEVVVLHEDVNRVQQELADLRARVEALEAT